MSRANNNLLNIQPTDHELKFPFELNKKTSSSLQFTNNTDGYVAFKVKTTNPKKYSASPNMGIVLPGTTCDVTVAMQAQKEAPQDMLQSKDKFLVQTTVVAAPTRNITSEIFSKESGRVIEEFKLRVIYVVPVANPVLRVYAAGSSPPPRAMASIPPPEIKFPFLLNKKTSCCLKLANQTDQYVAFKVKTSSGNKFCARPNMGILLPGTTRDVTVTMRAPGAQEDMLQCIDKILIQSIVLREMFNKETAVLVESIGLREMFNKESADVVDIQELKLRVNYVPANPLQVQQGSDQGSSSTPSLASCVDNGSQTTCCIKTSNNLLNMQCEIG
ncbi:hypothetical protein C5167_040077 [Papaver somniferum]|uniref:MSP domain-containing protein n=1 Tax=Papaver somniferum TaxID=3469 RepID=A0A4Y7IGD2_PAPSO|nr:hypothetical protein C5167_040077 [Papaver somniferum]